MEKSFRHNAIFVGSSIRNIVEQKLAEFTPCLYSESPRLFKENILPLDVALIELTPPDEDGFCSFGVSVSHNKAVAECAKIVIAQINSLMPRTGGAKIHLAAINFIVEQDENILEFKPPTISDVEKAIGENVAGLVCDGATLQIGVGTIPDAVLLGLKNKKDLGIHSEMFSDGVMNLAEAGVITNRKKTINAGKFTASFLMGTKRLYDFVNNIPMLSCSR
jgi:4-hydroxybutyrate CoA-transferase